MSRIVKKTTMNGTEFVFRYPEKSDLRELWRYINALSQEQTFISFRGEKITLEEEKKYLNNWLEQIAKKQKVHILVFDAGHLVGAASVDMGVRVEKHIGSLAIALAKEYRGQGLGKLLMNTVIDEAIKELKDLEIIRLTVYAQNKVAQGLYKKFGFKEYGVLPKGVKYPGGYDDHVLMYLDVSSRK